VADNSKIEWTESTWNFISGCTKISDGCQNCYIERTPPFRMAHRRFDKPGIGGKTGVILHEDKLTLPLKWQKPRRIFVNSLADLFHEDVPDEFIIEAFTVMARAEQHTFQVLTKRHARMRSLLNDPSSPWLGGWAKSWPLPNVWLGVSVESQKWADIRVPALLDTPAAVRWLSCEPLLGPVDLHYCDGVDAIAQDWNAFLGAPHPLVDWVVCGGESGPGARPMHPDWARSLRDQCQAEGVPYFFKQWGEWVAPDQMPEDTFMSWDVAHGTGAYDRGQPWRIGKKAAGRLLDGRTWDEYPQVAEAVTV
jgi:protein gp37